METSQLYKRLAAGLALGLLATSAMALELVAKPLQPSSKPDITVLGVTRIDGQPKQIKVMIKNIGTAPAGGSLLYASNTSQGGAAGAQVPSFAAGEAKYMVITLPAPPQRGARIKVEADINKQVTESNETNNVNYFTY